MKPKVPSACSTYFADPCGGWGGRDRHSSPCMRAELRVSRRVASDLSCGCGHMPPTGTYAE
ncbi:hypothetical protein E2562_012263 [Oryza meyeriana var. granulata]|uniref:Uncharacterized protein n=1 Tax=Oryza meyeriana var. granulata TaxID=110450 RepID=A0A6G1D2Q7_9ORYZ|nr:hypothetical protein E2562_012263 [Oryza meyeriana var. granulata]